MDRERILEKLASLDLGEDGAEVYLALIRLGPSKASDIAQAVRFSRPKVYRVLDDLSERGAATASLGSPTVFEAKAPDELLEQRLDELDRAKRRVADLGADLLPALADLPGERSCGATGASWTLIEGRRPILRNLRELTASAQTSIDAVSNHPLITHKAPLVEALWQAGIDRARKGVHIRALLDPSTQDLDVLSRWFDLPAVDVRTDTLGDPVSFVVVDDREAAVWLVMDLCTSMDVEDEVLLRTDAPGLLSILRRQIELRWRAAQPLGARGRDRDARA